MTQKRASTYFHCGPNHYIICKHYAGIAITPFTDYVYNIARSLHN